MCDRHDNHTACGQFTVQYTADEVKHQTMREAQKDLYSSIITDIYMNLHLYVIVRHLKHFLIITSSLNGHVTLFN